MQPLTIAKTGTTTVGIVCRDGVVMGADQRATMGHLIEAKETQKVFRIDDHLAMTIAGSVGDAQVLVRWLRSEVNLYRVKRGAPMSVKAAATMMASILNQRKFAPFYVQLIIGGVDLRGGHVYSLDAAGGVIPEKYVTTGSGSVFAYGVLEDRHVPDLSLDEGLDLAMRALHAAMGRDSASGNGIRLAVIKPGEAYRELTPEQLQTRRERLGLG